MLKFVCCKKCGRSENEIQCLLHELEQVHNITQHYSWCNAHTTTTWRHKKWFTFSLPVPTAGLDPAWQLMGSNPLAWHQSGCQADHELPMSCCSRSKLPRLLLQRQFHMALEEKGIACKVQGAIETRYSVFVSDFNDTPTGQTTANAKKACNNVNMTKGSQK